MTNTFPNGHPLIRRWEEIVDHRSGKMLEYWPRKYRTPEGFMSTKVNAGILACVLHEKFETPQEAPAATTAMIAATCAHHYGQQYFWVKKDLATALLNTRMPDNMLTETPWPFHGFTIMLPWGAFPAADGGCVGILNVGVVGMNVDDVPVPLPHLAGQPSPKLSTGSPILDGNDAMFIYAAVVKENGDLSDLYSHLNLHGKPDQALADQLWVTTKCYEGDVTKAPPGGIEVIHSLSRLVVNMCYLLAAKPELVEASTPGPVKKPRSQDPTWWEPRWVGRRYVIQREVASTAKGSHASPRMHWRRGHFREQAVGAGRKDRRTTWLEPMLVNAPKEETT